MDMGRLFRNSDFNFYTREVRPIGNGRVRRGNDTLDIFFVAFILFDLRFFGVFSEISPHAYLIGVDLLDRDRDLAFRIFVFLEDSFFRMGNDLVFLEIVFLESESIVNIFKKLCRLSSTFLIQ